MGITRTGIGMGAVAVAGLGGAAEMYRYDRTAHEPQRFPGGESYTPATAYSADGRLGDAACISLIGAVAGIGLCATKNWKTAGKLMVAGGTAFGLGTVGALAAGEHVTAPAR
jgi:hypothetical protein